MQRGGFYGIIRHMKSLLKIFTILTKKQLRLCWAIVGAMFLGAVFEAFGVAALYPLISIIANKDFLQTHQKIATFVAHFGITEHRPFIMFSSIALMFFFLFKNLVVFLETRFQIYFSVGNECDYTKRLFEYYLRKPYLYHVNINSSVLIRNISSGAKIVFQGILMTTLGLITELITAIIIWLTILVIDPILALCVAFFMGPLVLVIIKSFRKRITAQGKLQREFNAEFVKSINQGLGAIKETKVMQTESYFANVFSESYTKFTNTTRSYLVIEKIPRALIECMSIAIFLLLIVVKIAMGSDPQSLVPTLGVLALAAVRLMPCTNRIVQAFNSIKFNMPFFTEMYPDLLIIKKQKSIDEEAKKAEKHEPLDFSRELRVQNLSFTYPNSTKVVIKNATFSIPKGSFVGIVGQSGAGKTTFVDILLGLLPPTGGDIFIDDTCITKNIERILPIVSYVPQTIYLVDGTIKENIALGIDTKLISEDEIKRSVEMAQLSEFVATLPKGLNTTVGERGVQLSGGQRQRIGIARALYKRPEILVLDEATSALDNETEKSITDVLIALKGKMTIISIAHRLSTLENCDFKIKFPQ